MRKLNRPHCVAFGPDVYAVSLFHEAHVVFSFRAPHGFLIFRGAVFLFREPHVVWLSRVVYAVSLFHDPCAVLPFHVFNVVSLFHGVYCLPPSGNCLL